MYHRLYSAWTRIIVNSLFDVVFGSSVELAKSSEEKGLLLVVGEGQSLDGLGGVSSTLLDGLHRAALVGGTPLVLSDGGGLVVSLMSDMKLVDLSESLILLGLSLLNLEAVVGAAGGLVVESGEVHIVFVEAFTSGFGTLLLDLEGRVFLGQRPQNAAWHFHFCKS